MLEIRDLVKVYPGSVTALKGIRLELPRGMFGLLGPNGSGKTTLMRILAGLLEPTSGQVFWDGVEVTGRPELIWPRLGYLPQDFGFYPHLSGEAMLLHLLRLKGVEAPAGLAKLCTELLARVNLTHAAERKVKGYSGGMRQRLGIAQAIAGDPDLVIVDEPTAGLDPEERVRFYRLLSELAEERTVLLSTHIVEDVAVLCPRLAVIRQGRLVLQTTPGQARQDLAGRVFEGMVPAARLEELAQRFRVTRTHLVEGRNVVRLHLPTGQPPEGFEPVEATLEDAYFVLMRQAEQAETAGPRRVEASS
ncbi:MAG: ABC transporter ATP-binding protein [Acidobacteriota bacterium]